MSEQAGRPGREGRPDSDLPSTAFAVLAVLSIMDEELSPLEIKTRAGYSLRHFYPAPAVSHIRRELRRMLSLGLVEERELPIGQVRRTHVYQTTPAGEEVLRRWASRHDAEEPVVRNSALLRVFLGAKTSPEAVLAVIDARIRQLDESIDAQVWGRRRSKELGLADEESMKYALAVGEYNMRALYFERSNLMQLRDTVLDFNTEAFKLDVSRARGQIRRRRPRTGDGDGEGDGGR